MIINDFRGDYAFLSNFFPAPVKWNDVLYPTVEHAYQAAKTTNEEDREWIRSAPTPAIAKKRGSLRGVDGRKIELRASWDAGGKVFVMTCLLSRKFEEEPLRSMLLATGDAELIEDNWWGDRFWGVCNGEGENHLGKILMRLRDEFRNLLEEQ